MKSCTFLPEIANPPQNMQGKCIKKLIDRSSSFDAIEQLVELSLYPAKQALNQSLLERRQSEAETFDNMDMKPFARLAFGHQADALMESFRNTDWKNLPRSKETTHWFELCLGIIYLIFSPFTK